MDYSKAVAVILIGLTLACGGGKDAQSAPEKTSVAGKNGTSAADLPDPCKLVTDQEISDLLWQGMEKGQVDAMRARDAKHVITSRVENVEMPAGRTCYFQHKRVAHDTVWSEGDFKLRTLARPTFDMFAESSPSKQQPIAGVGDQAFYMSNAAYGRRGNVGIEVVEFGSKDVEVELLKKAVARLP